MNWPAPALFWFVFLFSILSSLIILVALAVMVLRLPSDRFSPTRRPEEPSVSLRRLAVRALNNLTGLSVVAVGVGMALPGIPGPGFLVVLLGILLLDFRQKPKFERWLISRFDLINLVNRFRRFFDREPFHLD